MNYLAIVSDFNKGTIEKQKEIICDLIMKGGANGESKDRVDALEHLLGLVQNIGFNKFFDVLYADYIVHNDFAKQMFELYFKTEKKHYCNVKYGCFTKKDIRALEARLIEANSYTIDIEMYFDRLFTQANCNQYKKTEMFGSCNQYTKTEIFGSFITPISVKHSIEFYHITKYPCVSQNDFYI
jgi:hypothetical protein